MLPVRLIGPQDRIYVTESGYYEVRHDHSTLLKYLHHETKQTNLLTTDWIYVSPNIVPSFIQLQNYKPMQLEQAKTKLPTNIIDEESPYYISTDLDNYAYPSQKERWKKEGRCQQCGELGRFINLQAVCSKHGPY